MILRSLPCVTLLLATTASSSVGQVVEGPRGSVEFIGLQQWNATELLEAIQELAPNQPLHACAATMKSQLGFPKAAVFLYPESDDGYRSDDSRLYTVIVGVEDRARVRYRAPGSKTLDLPEPWQALMSSLTDPDGRVSGLAGGVMRGLIDAGRARSVRVGPDPRTPEGAARRDQLVRVPDRAESTDRHRDRADVRDRADSGNAEPPARSRRRRARRDTGNCDPAPADSQWRGFRSGSGGWGCMVEPSPPF